MILNYLIKTLIVICFSTISIAIEREFFQVPSKKFIAVNETVTISCRAKNPKPGYFVLKRHGEVMSLGCEITTDEQPLKMSCGVSGSWHYLNATIPRVTWKSRGEYICVDDQTPLKLDLAVSVPATITMTITNVSYNQPTSLKSIFYKDEKLSGIGSMTAPFKLLSRDIKIVSINCSSQWAFPPAEFKWTVTPVATQFTVEGKIVEGQPYKERENVKFISNSTETQGLYRSSSIIDLDCTKLSNLIKVECSNVNQEPGEFNHPRYYFLCPDQSSILHANSSRVKSRKMASKITAGEWVNIVIGCTIGLILLISGIILICRHRTKDEIERYTMRQNSIEHAGYRV